MLIRIISSHKIEGEIEGARPNALFIWENLMTRWYFDRNYYYMRVFIHKKLPKRYFSFVTEKI